MEKAKIDVTYNSENGISLKFTMHKENKVSEDDTTETFLYKNGKFNSAMVVANFVFFAFVFTVFFGVYGFGFLGYFVLAHFIGIIAACIIYLLLNKHNDDGKKGPELLKEDEE